MSTDAKMTKVAALAMARQLWGDRACVAETAGENVSAWFHVGVRNDIEPDRMETRGVGRSWEEAFADAKIATIRAIREKEDRAAAHKRKANLRKVK